MTRVIDQKRAKPRPKDLVRVNEHSNDRAKFKGEHAVALNFAYAYAYAYSVHTPKCLESMLG